VVIARHNKSVAKPVNYENRKKRGPNMTEFPKRFNVKGKPLSETVVDMRKEERY